jgi:hypothetical protein
LSLKRFHGVPAGSIHECSLKLSIGKASWLPFSAYECLNALSEALETILSHVGSEYQITFA